MATPYNDVDRRLAGAQALLLAKMSEFRAHAFAGDVTSAERTRTEAGAVLDFFFDLTEQSVRSEIKRGY